MKLGCRGGSSTASGSSSTSCPLSVVAVSKSGSNSSGGTSTTVLRLPGPCPEGDAGPGGRFRATGFTRGGFGAGLPAGARPRGFGVGARLFCGGGGGGGRRSEEVSRGGAV